MAIIALKRILGRLAVEGEASSVSQRIRLRSEDELRYSLLRGQHLEGSHGEIRMMQLSQVVQSNPDILGGTPVFVGTRVPVQSLFDHLEGGDTLDEFLHQFPSVKREQAIAALDLARDSLLAGTRPS
jgi:uncharacterized protein (DUF433 family)